MKTVLIVALGFFFGLYVGAPSDAGSLAQGFGQGCGPLKTVLAQLQKRYSEVPVSMGLASNGSVIEILAAPGGSFTIIMTQTNGLACVMAAGESWEHLPPKVKGPRT